MVTCRSFADSVTALPSKSTACTRLDRSMVVAPLWSIDDHSVKFHDPSLSSASVNTLVPAVEPPV